MTYIIVYCIIGLITAIVAYSIFNDMEPALGIGALWPIGIFALIIIAIVKICIELPGKLLRKHVNLEEKIKEVKWKWSRRKE